MRHALGLVATRMCTRLGVTGELRGHIAAARVNHERYTGGHEATAHGTADAALTTGRVGA